MPRLFSVLLILTASACSSTAPVVEVEPEAEPAAPSGPAFATLEQEEGGISLAGSRVDGISGITGPAKLYPGGAEGAVLLAVVSDDSTRLFRAAAEGLDRVHAVAGNVVYTARWSPDGTAAAFGHYRPLGQASQGRPSMGSGDILLADSDGVRPVGCSASRAVLAWTPNGDLLVRNTDNLYVVEPDGCGTVTTVDARRMLDLTASPDGRHLAFVHRELEYDRAARAYVADSTFRLTDIDGGNPRTVVSFRYQPRRLGWNPTGTELAFDVLAPELGTRAISIFDVATGTASFLHPPTAAAEEYSPVYSPAGDRIAYLRIAGDGAPEVWVRSFETQYPEALPQSASGAILHWVDNTTLAVRHADGAVYLHHVGSSGLDPTPAGGAIWAWRLR